MQNASLGVDAGDNSIPRLQSAVGRGSGRAAASSEPYGSGQFATQAALGGHGVVRIALLALGRAKGRIAQLTQVGCQARQTPSRSATPPEKRSHFVTHTGLDQAISFGNEVALPDGPCFTMDASARCVTRT